MSPERMRTTVGGAAVAGLLLVGPGGAPDFSTAAPAPLQDTTAAVVEDTSQAELPAEARAPGTPLVVAGDTVGVLYADEGIAGPERRASEFADRIRGLKRDGMTADSVSVDTGRDPPLILVGGRPVLAVLDGDAEGLGLPVDAAVAVYTEAVRRSLAVAPLDVSDESLPVSIGLVVLATILLWLLWRALKALQPRAAAAANHLVARRVQSVHFRGVELLAAAQVQRGIEGAAWLVRWALSLTLLAGYFPLVFWFFPATRGIAFRILQAFAGPFERAGLSVLQYLPNLINIAVIVFLTKKGIDLMGLVFRALERGSIRVKGFYKDWARPTYQLLRILVVAFALVVVWPYLPGSSSPAFQGVAAFIGLLVTFGSAGAVSNAVGGVMMVYMRPFQVGDRVQIADTMGEVVERGILVTRIRTPKRVVITIPNSQVMGTHIVNYSRIAQKTGLILHTTVTIGYDVPWPKVHEALKSAAGAVEGVMADPPPFVLQTALGDYAVSYELNASTQEPERMAQLYSDLHRNIQNEFARAGIEITSPVYHAVRDGNPVTIPPSQEVTPAHVEEDEIPSEAELDEEDLDYAGADAPDAPDAPEEPGEVDPSSDDGPNRPEGP